MRIDLPEALRAPGRLCDALGCATIGRDLFFGGIATDSREIKAGDLFVALRGQRQSGADFAVEAAQRGAVAMLCDEACAQPAALPVLRVTCVTDALRGAAHAWRCCLDGAFIAVGGSSGKTTVKELLATVLATSGTVQKSEGNFNSGIGLPLSLLAMSDADYHVLEIGVNHVGEMAPLSATLSPTLAVLTGVGNAHIGNFGSKRALLKEKLCLADGLTQDGRLLLPVQLCACAPYPLRTLSFGSAENADFCVCNVRHGPNGVSGDLRFRAECLEGLTWPLPGRVGLSCLTLGGAVGLYYGLSRAAILRGLSQAAANTPRMKRALIHGRCVIDDTYNASPEAMIAALETLCYLSGSAPRAAVLGDMGELGGFSVRLHREVGAAAAGAGLSHLFLYGKQAGEICRGALDGGLSPKQVHCFAPGEEDGLVAAIFEAMPRGAYILCKASRQTGLDRVMARMERIS